MLSAITAKPLCQNFYAALTLPCNPCLIAFIAPAKTGKAAAKLASVAGAMKSRQSKSVASQQLAEAYQHPSALISQGGIQHANAS